MRRLLIMLCAAMLAAGALPVSAFALERDEAHRNYINHLLVKAWSFCESGRYDTCLALAQKALKEDPGNPTAIHISKVAFRRRRGNFNYLGLPEFAWGSRAFGLHAGLEGGALTHVQVSPKAFSTFGTRTVDTTPYGAVVGGVSSRFDGFNRFGYSNEGGLALGGSGDAKYTAVFWRPALLWVVYEPDEDTSVLLALPQLQLGYQSYQSKLNGLGYAMSNLDAELAARVGLSYGRLMFYVQYSTAAEFENLSGGLSLCLDD